MFYRWHRSNQLSASNQAGGTQKNSMDMFLEPIWLPIRHWFKGQDREDLECAEGILCATTHDSAHFQKQRHRPI